MPTGNVSLLEAAKGGSEPFKAGVITTIIQESPVIEMLPWIPIQGNAYRAQVEDSLPTPAFRSVNENYSKSWGTDDEHFWGVTILGGEVFIDNFLLRVVSDRVSQKAKQFAKFAKATALTFDKTFFDGTGTAKDFKGVNALIDEGFGQKLVNAANGGVLSLDKMDEAHDLLRTGTADAILLNRTVRRKITYLARNTTGYFSLLDTGTDVFGRQVLQWNGIPLRIIGDDANGSAILGFDEDPGDAVSDCASMYFVRFGDDHVAGLLGAGGSMDVQDFGETQASPGHLGRLEWYPGIAVFNRYSIVRLYGITNA